MNAVKRNVYERYRSDGSFHRISNETVSVDDDARVVVENGGVARIEYGGKRALVIVKAGGSVEVQAGGFTRATVYMAPGAKAETRGARVDVEKDEDSARGCGPLASRELMEDTQEHAVIVLETGASGIFGFGCMIYGAAGVTINQFGA